MSHRRYDFMQESFSLFFKTSLMQLTDENSLSVSECKPRFFPSPTGFWWLIRHFKHCKVSIPFNNLDFWHVFKSTGFTFSPVRNFIMMPCATEGGIFFSLIARARKQKNQLNWFPYFRHPYLKTPTASTYTSALPLISQWRLVYIWSSLVHL